MKFLAWFSCGVTSAVACKLAIDKYGDDVDIWYIETGAAHSDNQRFIEDCENWYGRKILTARHPKFKNPLEIAAIEVFNTPWGAPCTKYLKKEVRQRIEKNYTQPIHVFGFEYNKKEINRAFRWKQQNSSRVYFSCCSICTVKCSLLNFEIAVFVSFFLIIIFEIDTFDSGLFQG